MTMTLIETVTVGSGGQAQIDFNSIPQTATDLFLVLSGRTTDASNWNDIYVRPNGLTTNQSMKSLYGFSTTVGSNTTSDIRMVATGTVSTSNTFGNSSAYIPNYSGSTNKSFSIQNSSENNSATSINQILAGLWSSTAAITSISLVPNAGNFGQYTTASLYGILKGSGGATVS